MAEGKLKILEELSFEEPKTKNLLAVLKALNIDENVLIVTENVDTAIVKSASNMNDTKVSSSNQLSILELLSHNTLLMTIQALRNIEKIWHARDDKNA
jgi:large subunit ribosomal protein L4